jgi:AbrB family looped-hinge helix DNA binding protein
MATQSIDVKVASNGRMILPASVRKAMGLHGDAKVILTVEDDQVRLSPIGHGVSRAQALYREHAKQASYPIARQRPSPRQPGPRVRTGPEIRHDVCCDGCICGAGAGSG